MASRRNKRPVDSGHGDHDPLAVLRRIEAALSPAADVPDVGEMTSDQWAEAWGVSPVHARRRLFYATRAEIISRRQLRCADGKKRLFYREKIAA